MSDAREQILVGMRHALGRDKDNEEAARKTVADRLRSSRPTLIPARGDLDYAGRIQLFIDQATSVQTDVEKIDHRDLLPATIATYLRKHNLPMEITMALDPILVTIDWRSSLLSTKQGAPGASDQVALTTAFAGIAETGTLMITSSAERPTMLAFLPETSIIVLSSDDVVRAYEDAMRLLRSTMSEMPRSINLITGPSRSGDIEQTLQLGAHGPRRLLTVLIDENAKGRHKAVPPTSS